ncbi:MAG: class I SAM-dependent methyltransferase [Rhodocyclaceae bacterium]|nr:class I SAM-dependent methyltransferase [Rhodocyclaceae bacterium]
MTGHAYCLDPVSLVWARSEYAGIAYSDSDAVEERLLATLRVCADVSAVSEELQGLISDWPSEYHLSNVRHNLLRPFDIGPGQRVLELGCGCGAMTRYLGETGAAVVAVEGSLRRAEIAAERCRDLDNVSVWVDNLAEFETEHRFDIVTLIGVLEYSRCFIAGDDPVAACLKAALRHLKPEGRLILSIENQLGLKYFNGAPEDHLGERYLGIEDRYGQNTPVTFGRRALKEKLASSGFESSRFYYPFPDYKLPEVILAEEAFDTPGFRPADLLARLANQPRNQGWQAFRENRVWPVLHRNGILGELANSFLVEAWLAPQHASAPVVLAETYSSRRNPCYQSRTRFLNHEEGIIVSKEPLHPEAPRCMETPVTQHLPPPGKYFPAYSHAQAFHALVARHAEFSEYEAWARHWLDCLMSISTTGGLACEAVDAIPGNLLVCEDVSLFIDLEWHWHGAPALHWILLRGLIDTLQRGCSAPNATLASMTLRNFAKTLFHPLGVEFRNENFDSATEWELTLRASVEPVTEQHADHLRRIWDICLDELTAYPSAERAMRGYERQLELHRADIAAAQAEITRIKHTVSWRITKPLRGVWNLASRMFS